MEYSTSKAKQSNTAEASLHVDFLQEIDERQYRVTTNNQLNSHPNQTPKPEIHKIIKLFFFF